MEVISKYYEINGVEYCFRNNMRAMIEIERLFEKIGPKSGMEETVAMLYCGTLSGMKHEKKEFNVEYEEFIDLVDDNFEALSTVFSSDEVKDAVDDSKKKSVTVIKGG